jgi:cytochrome c oxidase cbb3-type subunit III
MGEYDGIREREEGRKKMPFGMAVLFLTLIASGLVYLYLFSPLTTGWKQVDQYERRMEAHKTAVISHEVKEVEAGLSGTKEDKGPAIYASECAMCHGEKLEGTIGPSLTGPKFIHGNTLADHVRVIANGTPNGMPGFQKQLGAEKVRAVAHYIYFKHGK